MNVHFWTRRPEALDMWDPDEQPYRHLNAYGHGFLELHRRLALLGHSVSIGSRIPAGTTAVVASMEELSEYQSRIPDRMAALLALACLRLRRMPALTVIRVDTGLHVDPPAGTTLELMPTRASIAVHRQSWLPMLPQRGLRTRDTQRGAGLNTVALKVYSENVPEWVNASFTTRLATLGFELRVDDEHSGRWADFREVDVVLCAHNPTTLRDELRKPATKLINAWRAGAIPICGDYIGYRELGVDGENALFVEGAGAEPYLAALARLRDEPELAERVRRALPSELYAWQSIADEYWHAFTQAPRARRHVLVGAATLSLGREARRRARAAIRR